MFAAKQGLAWLLSSSLGLGAAGPGQVHPSLSLTARGVASPETEQGTAPGAREDETEVQPESQGSGVDALDPAPASAKEGAAASNEVAEDSVTPTDDVDAADGEEMGERAGDGPSSASPDTASLAPRAMPSSRVRVAVGLAPEAPGSAEERRLVDALVTNFEDAKEPAAEVRRLRSGAATARRVCAEGRDDLVVTVGYLPDRPGPAVFTRDCALELELGVRRAAAASTPGLLGALWDEREAAVADGAQVRRRPGLSSRARTGLIAGGALLAIGLAVGIVLANTLREDTTVITVSP